MSPPTRERFLTAAAGLFRRQGYSGTGLKQIVAESGGPIGSLYYFFPGGKEDLALQAIAHTAERYEELLDRVFAESADIGQAATKWFGWAGHALEESDFADGCPVGTLACEIASTNEALRRASDAVFDSWRSRVAAQLISEGVKPAAARRLAMFALASLEGAIMLSRSQRSPQPLRDTGRVVADTLRAATG
ncbi:TetR/AcrR family transcriptional regulator [Mycobacterium branderi]|uniref:TetR family transcriptional regulator n=1 Tax=Mycobacterium branderi TaxID=43348 RepID=A0A7I7W5X3_9MYCO|nr:TetR/AcrR family transcriptional regulator [Mycobacterium branderi]MCV7236032.1 TetR family transcriptional regulator C-terminal domain-containing protein [Mycobacterium branderi]ORA32785.1 TetR family transcriptional regulator [Mycobacterium branderi]BBZ12091.1 putative transcriptional regulator, TetR family protein [Mycobacterium branderi]